MVLQQLALAGSVVVLGPALAGSVVLLGPALAGAWFYNSLHLLAVQFY
jgi:hypothetical protein